MRTSTPPRGCPCGLEVPVAHVRHATGPRCPTGEKSTEQFTLLVLADAMDGSLDDVHDIRDVVDRVEAPTNMLLDHCSESAAEFLFWRLLDRRDAVEQLEMVRHPPS